MASTESLYRKTAMERLSSPEQLDRLVTVTDPIGWLLLTTLALLFGSAVLWGIFGSIPYTVSGQGILISDGGRIVNVTAPEKGTVDAVLIANNQEVKEGQEIVRLHQPALEEALSNAKAMLDEKIQERERAIDVHQSQMELKLINFAKQKTAQRELIELATERKQYLEDILVKREAMLESGLLSRHTVAETRQQFNSVVQEIASANNRILELDGREMDLEANHVSKLATLGQEISAAKRRVAEAQAILDRTSSVKSPVSGTVTEIKVAEGVLAQSGASLVSVAAAGSNLETVLYVPTLDGKKLRPGMSVKVSPATVRKEEYGTVLGELRSISEFPATTEGMQSVLQNSTLVQSFALKGAPYEARVTLLRSDESPSGYQWTSGLGPNLQISSGTLVTASVTVQEVPPIVIVMPFLRKGLLESE